MATLAASKDISEGKQSIPLGSSIKGQQPVIVELTGRNNNFIYPTQVQVFDEIITSKGYVQVRDDKDPNRFKTKMGSANFTYFFKHPDPTVKPQELVFRRTKDPIYLDGFNVNTIEQGYQDGDVEEDDESKRTRVNWLQSSQLNIAPKIYFYGYIRKPAQDSGLYLAVVSEGFDSDLDNFYKKVYTRQNKHVPTGYLTVTDLSIQRQLTHQLNMIAKEMDVVCFDIKPLNAVISYKPDGCNREASLTNPIVRLIDWDGDYCIKYASHMNKNKEIKKVTTKLGRNNREVKKHITELINNRVLEGYISNIIMANHFFVNFNRNIFANYFNSIKHEIELVKPILQEYFCSIMYGSPRAMFGSSVTASVYHFFGKFYLQQFADRTPIRGRIGVSPFKDSDKKTPEESPKYAMCRKLFNEMYKRIFIINNQQLLSPAFNAASAAAIDASSDAASAAASAAASDAGPSESKQGGKRSRKYKKRKTRKHKKSKKKRKRKSKRNKRKKRKTKRKNRKTRK